MKWIYLTKPYEAIHLIENNLICILNIHTEIWISQRSPYTHGVTFQDGKPKVIHRKMMTDSLQPYGWPTHLFEGHRDLAEDEWNWKLRTNEATLEHQKLCTVHILGRTLGRICTNTTSPSTLPKEHGWTNQNSLPQINTTYTWHTQTLTQT